jgi:hypothetical protein
MVDFFSRGARPRGPHRSRLRHAHPAYHPLSLSQGTVKDLPFISITIAGERRLPLLHYSLEFEIEGVICIQIREGEDSYRLI